MIPPRSGARTGRLLALNALLALGVLMLATLPRAGAQPAAQGPARSRGAYTMIASKSNNGPLPLIHIIDATNQEMVTLKWDQSRSQFVGASYRDLRADAEVTPGR